MIQHALIYFFVRAGNGVFGILILAAFTRLLSAEEYGKYSLIVASASIFSMTFFGWIGVAANRFYPSLRQHTEITQAVRIGYLASLLISVICFLVAFVVFEQVRIYWILAASIFLLAIIQGWYDVALQTTNAQGLALRYGMLAWTRGAVFLGAGILLVVESSSAVGAVAGNMIGACAAVLIFSPFPRKPHPASELNADQLTARQLFRYGAPLTVTFLSVHIVGVGDRLLLGWLRGPEAVAPYAATYDLVQQSIGALMSVLFLAAFPRILGSLDQGDENEARTKTRKFGGILLCVGVGATVGLCIIARDIAFLVFGAQFKDTAAQLIPWIAPAVAISAFKGFFLDLPFQFRRITRVQGYIAVAMAVTNILLNILWIPDYGSLGAAWAALASFAIGSAISFLAGRNMYALPFISIREVGKIVGACCVMASFLWIVGSVDNIYSLSLKILVAGLLYGTCIWGLDFGDVRSRGPSEYLA